MLMPEQFTNKHQNDVIDEVLTENANVVRPEK